jgi:hemerythrin-like metal-binding protein
VELLNAVYDAFTAGSSEQIVGNVLEELSDYATYHFTAEEFWMMKHAYPNADAHNREHAFFSRRVMEIRSDYANGRTQLSREIQQFLQGWLKEHILTADADYAQFEAGENLRSA